MKEPKRVANSVAITNLLVEWPSWHRFWGIEPSRVGFFGIRGGVYQVVAISGTVSELTGEAGADAFRFDHKAHQFDGDHYEFVMRDGVWLRSKPNRTLAGDLCYPAWHHTPQTLVDAMGLPILLHSHGVDLCQ